jgi:hypothetical protein
LSAGGLGVAGLGTILPGESLADAPFVVFQLRYQSFDLIGDGFGGWQHRGRPWVHGLRGF